MKTRPPKKLHDAPRKPQSGTAGARDRNADRTPEDKDASRANARDFLDRRDEARISHRLGRPFRF